MKTHQTCVSLDVLDPLGRGIHFTFKINMMENHQQCVFEMCSPGILSTIQIQMMEHHQTCICFNCLSPPDSLQVISNCVQIF